jgi:hypothetical protein
MRGYLPGTEGGLQEIRCDRRNRLPDGESERGIQATAVFEFEYDGKNWALSYDPGSDQTFAAVRIDPS